MVTTDPTWGLRSFVVFLVVGDFLALRTLPMEQIMEILPTDLG